VKAGSPAAQSAQPPREVEAEIVDPAAPVEVDANGQPLPPVKF
jgi:hypothetical protein